MTVPCERTRSVQHVASVTRQILFSVKQKHPKFLRSKTKEVAVSADLLRKLYHATRHYPGYTDLYISAVTNPKIWGKPEFPCECEEDVKCR